MVRMVRNTDLSLYSNVHRVE